MPTQFQRPNKTKSLFAQVDAQRPQYARTKLAGAEGAVGMLRNSANANDKEGQNVQQTQQQMVTTGAQGQKSVRELDGFKTADSIMAEGNAQIAKGPPVFQTAFDNNEKNQSNVFVQGPSPQATSAPGFGGMPAPDFSNAPDGYRVDGGVDANVAGNQIHGRNNELEQKTIQLADGTIKRVDDLDLGSELSQKYGAASDTLSGFERMATQGNLGILADESDFEMEQEKLAQVLADRESNIGKLKALYGVGYDTSKYGALDSNILQGQFNDLQSSARDGLKAKDDAEKGLGRTKEAYLNEAGNQKTQLDKVKVETEAKVTKINGELQGLQEKLEGLKTDTSAAAKAARTKINDEIGKLETARKAAIDKAGTEVAGKNTRYKLRESIGISNDEAQKLDDVTVSRIEKLMSGTANTVEIEQLRKDIGPYLMEKIYSKNPNLRKTQNEQVEKVAPMEKDDIAKAAATGGLSVLLDKSKSGDEKKESIRRTYRKYIK